MRNRANGIWGRCFLTKGQLPNLKSVAVYYGWFRCYSSFFALLSTKTDHLKEKSTQAKFLLDGFDINLKRFLVDGFRYGFRVNFVGERVSAD